MKYEIDIYEKNSENTLRFLLGKSGKRPLFIIGLNPSTADGSKPDTTISKVMRFAESNNYDGFIMINLYPQRTPYPEKLDKVMNQEYHKENLQRVGLLLQKYSKVNFLSAWGNNICIRDYLIKCLKDMNETFNLMNLNIHWWHIGDFTKTGHPRHPSRVPYVGLKPMDIEDYIKILYKK